MQQQKMVFFPQEAYVSTNTPLCTKVSITATHSSTRVDIYRDSYVPLQMAYGMK